MTSPAAHPASTPAPRNDRRKLLLAGAVLSLPGFVLDDAGAGASPKDKDAAKESANEDLMREHGVLRRALLAYGAIAQRLRIDPRSVPSDALLRTAQVFRTFGEDYHERRIEEAFIFPAVRKLKLPVARYPDVLQQQHERGRALNDRLIEIARTGRFGDAEAPRIADALEGFALMYEHHAAREDTEVFAAWKASIPPQQYAEMGERFETIEREQLGHDGFDDALAQIARVETQLGMPELGRFTIEPVAQLGI